MKQEGRRPNAILFLAALLAVLALVNYLHRPREEQPSYAEVKALFEQEKVESFTLSDTTLTLRLRGVTKPVTKDVYDFDLFYEDMNALAMKLDMFLDFINHSAKTILMYNPKKIDKQIKEIVDNIHEDATTIMEVFGMLEDLGKNHQQINDLCQKVTLIEHAVDDIYGDYISYLFSNEHDEIELLKYKEIAQAVEDTTDRAKEVTSTVKSIIIKES